MIEPPEPAPIDPDLSAAMQRVIDASPFLTWLNDPSHIWIIVVVLFMELVLHVYVVMRLMNLVCWCIELGWSGSLSLVRKWRASRVENRPGS